MSVNLHVPATQNRENRLGSITGYCGSMKFDSAGSCTSIRSTTRGCGG